MCVVISHGEIRREGKCGEGLVFRWKRSWFCVRPVPLHHRLLLVSSWVAISIFQTRHKIIGLESQKYLANGINRN